MLALENARLKLEVEAESLTLLVIGDSHYPEWRAALDGEAAEIHIANLCFRGIFVPAGRHTVELWYAGETFRIGAALSIISLLCLCVFLYVRRKEFTIEG